MSYRAVTLLAFAAVVMPVFTPAEPARRIDMLPLPSSFDSYAAPRVLARVEPRYSAEALLARLEGSVRINAVVDREGSIMDLKVLRSLGMGLDEAALGAVDRWTFAPGDL